ncbi:17539_t:CDS:2 [Funneliformis geosporum]|uniref:3885_t:CDS:1 n=1 Tax=Funneliformis geosporum TaxID=1117311 RepID=A0A9W4SG35_9GLOM|nr:17539_t:CDS:2 [Funneliformis geosporum]CAI2168283.1 3885_t:CDS:2 [Funneliformis geosporum]
MTELHTYYIINATTEMNYTHSNLSKEELYKIFNKSLSFSEFSDEIYEQIEEFNFIDNNEDLAEEYKIEILNKNNEIIIEKLFDFNNTNLISNNNNN